MSCGFSKLSEVTKLTIESTPPQNEPPGGGGVPFDAFFGLQGLSRGGTPSDLKTRLRLFTLQSVDAV